MDTYSKAVFTVIAAALVAIAVNISFKPTPASAILGLGPTFGDWVKAKGRDRRAIRLRVPLVFNVGK